MQSTSNFGRHSYVENTYGATFSMKDEGGGMPSGVEYEGGVSHGLEWIRHASHALRL